MVEKESTLRFEKVATGKDLLEIVQLRMNWITTLIEFLIRIEDEDQGHDVLRKL